MTAVLVALVILTLFSAQKSSAAMAYPAPVGLKSSFSSPSTITLSWGGVAGAKGYRLQQASNLAMSGSTYYSFTGTTADIRGLTPDTTYYFQVRVIDAAGTGVSEYSARVAVKTATKPVLQAVQNALRVATYNVSCEYCFASRANELPWIGRRDAVVKTVLGQRPDVLGVQEASSGRLKSDTSTAGLAQFEDLTNRLVAAGTPYKLSNTKRNNCVDDQTPSNCVYQYKGASGGTKILYNSGTVELLSQGSQKLATQTGADDRYFAWAILRQRATGKVFFFGNAHLIDHMSDPAFFALRTKQAEQVITAIAAKNTGKYPVVMVGDFNSNKWTAPSNAPYDAFIKAGYIDPLGNTYKSDLPSSAATAEKTIRANFESYNGFARKAPARNSYGNGTYMDYIFTSKMRTTVWENVLNIDSTGNFVGTIPSDHNMIRADVQLP
ncbi:endonuclease/exonuclease/phosphatase family protein [Arthrobacter sp. B3I9]|uniref:endonuclease/exonuclease/phosphatase family protein n=1 Tax=Arthrobacter sp. B3I9 TaxID=3042270 RepID=UPI0027D92A7A|nr:endonuclease/exonuclease/phosphatase family protein [Arthrobacter sp. B3I9]